MTLFESLVVSLMRAATTCAVEQTDIYQIRYVRNGKWLFYETHDGVEIRDTEGMFRISCKNLSELKKILSQLNLKEG